MDIIGSNGLIYDEIGGVEMSGIDLGVAVALGAAGIDIALGIEEKNKMIEECWGQAVQVCKDERGTGSKDCLSGVIVRDDYYKKSECAEKLK